VNTTVSINRSTCPQCAEAFERYETSRPSRYCGRTCQSRAAATRINARRAPTGNALGRPRKAQATTIAGGAIRVNSPQHSLGVEAPKYAAFGLRAAPRLKGETLKWEAYNEVTHKVSIAGKNANANALGFTMKTEGCVHPGDDGWWGVVGKEFSFGPSTLDRAKAATEAFLRRDPLLPPRDHERYRQGTVWKLIGGS
jgi:hypothetical protein